MSVVPEKPYWGEFEIQYYLIIPQSELDSVIEEAEIEETIVYVVEQVNNVTNVMIVQSEEEQTNPDMPSTPKVVYVNPSRTEEKSMQLLSKFLIGFIVFLLVVISTLLVILFINHRSTQRKYKYIS